MKHFVTALLFCTALFIGAGLASAQQVRSVRQVGSTAGVQSTPSVFLPNVATAPVFAKGSALQPLTNYDTMSISYFNDTTGGNSLFLPGNDTTIPSGVGQDTITYITHGYAEIFSSSFAKTYLDSIHVELLVDTIPATNHITASAFHVTDQNTTSGSQLPFLDLSVAPFATNNYAGSLLPAQTDNVFTIKFTHKLVGSNPNFAVFLDRTGSVPASSDIEANKVIYHFDGNTQSQRQLDTTMDRSLKVELSPDEHWISQGYMAGRYRLVSDTTLFFYPNLIMIAYVDDGKAAGVERTDLPSEYRLAQNYPNPVSSTTAINYAIPTPSKVSMIVYNALGQAMQTLVNSTQGVGEHSVNFDASSLPTGLYFYTLKAGNFSQTNRMIVTR